MSKLQLSAPFTPPALSCRRRRRSCRQLPRHTCARRRPARCTSRPNACPGSCHSSWQGPLSSMSTMRPVHLPVPRVRHARKSHVGPAPPLLPGPVIAISQWGSSFHSSVTVDARLACAASRRSLDSPSSVLRPNLQPPIDRPPCRREDLCGGEVGPSSISSSSSTSGYPATKAAKPWYTPQILLSVLELPGQGFAEVLPTQAVRDRSRPCQALETTRRSRC